MQMSEMFRFTSVKAAHTQTLSEQHLKTNKYGHFFNTNRSRTVEFPFAVHQLTTTVDTFRT